MPIYEIALDAKEVLFRIQKSLTGEQRLMMALELSMFVKELIKADVRRDHPDWSEALVERELLRLAFLPDPLPPGLDEYLECHPLSQP